FDEMSSRIRRQVEEMRGLEDMRRELITNVSHDLRTPIAALQGYLDTLLLKGEEVIGAEREEYLGIALSQCQRLGRLVEELFELTKLESKAVEPHFEAVSIAELVQDNLMRFRLPAAEKRIHLEAELGPEMPFVRADLRLMERVLENLIENAVRFTPEGGQIEVGVEDLGSRVRLQISDTGCGIAEEELPAIFDRFYRCQFQADSGYRGAGLGLAISQRILDLHGSRFNVESQVGVGTRFSFELPAVEM
ncbi:MAG: two-component sensor histidine kinase, partial [Acidobacteria bacterium]|nr:two-component sensor histidine kinase [Acidobacteriota bacterium]